jgi:FkbH-like protein
VSKNDPEPVDEALQKHPMMVLRQEDFVRVITDWGNKADHIRALADDLSLGLDTFVLLDDNPFERGLIESELPDVLTPDFPTRPERLSDWFLSDVVPSFFPRVRVLGEDRAKTSQYQSRAERKRAEETNLDEFLASLDMRVSFRIDDADSTPRLSQLTQKTNQFNLSVERATPADVAAWISDPKMAVVACDYSDRFGDEGTIGLAVIDLDQAMLRNLLLSCRVLGRGVEDLLLSEVARILDESGHTEFSARVVTTARNGIARTFMARHGFHATTSDDDVWTRAEDTACTSTSKTS